jgi:hypothetical protein
MNSKAALDRLRELASQYGEYDRASFPPDELAAYDSGYESGFSAGIQSAINALASTVTHEEDTNVLHAGRLREDLEVGP